MDEMEDCSGIYWDSDRGKLKWLWGIGGRINNDDDESRFYFFFVIVTSENLLGF